MMPQQQPQVQPGQPIDRTPVFKAAVAKYGPTMGLTMPEAQQMYQQMLVQAQKKGQDLAAVPNARLWMIIEQIVDHPKMQQIHKQAVAAAKNPQQAQQAPAPQPVTSNMLHMAGGGDLPGGQAAVVGDNPDGGPDNSEVVANPPGNAPVTVNPSGNTVSDAISSGHQQGIQQATQTVANVLGISPAAVMKAYTPDQIAAAYQQFDAKIKAAAPGNSASGLFAALGQYSNPNSMKEHDEQVATQRSNIANDTIGKTLQEQKSLGEGVTAASGVQTANQNAAMGDLGLQAKQIEVKNAGLGSDLLAQKNDATSNISKGVRASLKGIGISLPESYSAGQAELILAGNAQAQKIIDDATKAEAEKTSAGAAATTAGTGRQKENFGEGLITGTTPNAGGKYVWEGDSAHLAPGETSSQTGFADRKTKAEANIPVLDQTVSLFGQAVKQGMDPAVQFGKYSPTQLASLGTKAGPTYAAEQMFNQLKTQNLANMVSTVGGAGELRIAGVDASAMNQAPTVTESKTAAMNKMFLKMDQAIKMQDVSHQLHNYTGPNNGSDFKVDNTGKIAVWNPNTNATSMIPRNQLPEAEKEGKYNVSDGYNGFLLSASRGGK